MEEFEIKFETERINYISLSEKLVYDYLDMVNDVEVQKCISYNREKYTLEQELQWIKNKLKENAIIFSMLEKKTNKYIGNIEIIGIKNNIGEIGIAITIKQQNKGFGQEAIKGLINYAFNKLNLYGLELYVYRFNPRAIHCYEKVGFKVIEQGTTEEKIHMKLVKEK